MNLTITAENGMTADWLSRLSQNGVLRWQHGETNLGLLLSPLLEVNGWQGDILSLCDALPRTTRVVTASDILGVMGALGYRIESKNIKLGSLKPEDTPGLFISRDKKQWREGIVIKEAGSFGMVWEDGREQHRGNLPDMEGEFFRFYRITAEDEPEEQSWLAMLFERFRPVMMHAVALSFVMHIFTLAMPLFSMVVYDRVISARSPETLLPLVAGVILALGVEHIVRWLRIRLAAWIGARSAVLATGAMFERLLFLPSSMIEQASVSAQLARVRAFESVRDFIAGPTFLTILEIPFLFILIFAIALLAGPVALIATFIVLLQIAVVLMLRRHWKNLGRESAHAAATRQQLMMDMITHRSSIYSSGLSDKMMQRFRRASWQAAITGFKFSRNSAILQHFAGFLTVVAGVATIAWSMQRIWLGEMTGGAMVATMIITWRVLYPLQALCAVMPQLEQIRASLDQVASLMSLAPEAHASPSVLGQHPINGKISIQNLGLRYGRKSDPVFLGLNAEIEKGEVVAIYGGNGTGKSSILRLLLGLYAPAMGTVRFDGVDYRQFDPRSLRRQIGYFSQDPELIPGTISDNLRLHDPLAEEHKLRHALLWADILDAVKALPEGMETEIGGSFVPSSGFAARLALARIYLSQRPVILCDELSAQVLNSSTGSLFRKFLEECRGKRTVIFVTHRHDWLALADKVIWLRPDARPLVTTPQQIKDAA